MYLSNWHTHTHHVTADYWLPLFSIMHRLHFTINTRWNQPPLIGCIHHRLTQSPSQRILQTILLSPLHCPSEMTQAKCESENEEKKNGKPSKAMTTKAREKEKRRTSDDDDDDDGAENRTDFNLKWNKKEKANRFFSLVNTNFTFSMVLMHSVTFIYTVIHIRPYDSAPAHRIWYNDYG